MMYFEMDLSHLCQVQKSNYLKFLCRPTSTLPINDGLSLIWVSYCRTSHGHSIKEWIFPRMPIDILAVLADVTDESLHWIYM